MGRKPTGRKRTEPMTIRFTKDEKSEVQDAVKESGKNQADFILSKIRGERDEN